MLTRSRNVRVQAGGASLRRRARRRGKGGVQATSAGSNEPQPQGAGGVRRMDGWARGDNWVVAPDRPERGETRDRMLWFSCAHHRSQRMWLTAAGQPDLQQCLRVPQNAVSMRHCACTCERVISKAPENGSHTHKV